MSGNCGCSKCGLRGWSKNVNTRNVFANWDYFPPYLQSYEMSVRLIEKDGHPFWAFKRMNYETDQLMTFSEVLKDMVSRSDFKPEHFDVIFCEHNWVQDPGTETA